MRVKVTVTVDIDPDAWAYEFGLEPQAVRSDVQTYFRGLVVDQLADLGLSPEETS